MCGVKPKKPPSRVALVRGGAAFGRKDTPTELWHHRGFHPLCKKCLKGHKDFFADLGLLEPGEEEE